MKDKIKKISKLKKKANTHKGILEYSLLLRELEQEMKYLMLEKMSSSNKYLLLASTAHVGVEIPLGRGKFKSDEDYILKNYEYIKSLNNCDNYLFSWDKEYKINLDDLTSWDIHEPIEDEVYKKDREQALFMWVNFSDKKVL